MVAIGEHRAPPTRSGAALADRCVEVLGGRDLKALHAMRERALVVGLDQQMDVGALDAEMNDPEVLAPRGDERRLAHRMVDAAAAQVADGAHHPQHDVHGIPRVEKRPLLVRRAGPQALRWPTGTAPLAAALLPQHQLLGLSSSPARTA
ncbi:MAG TPA: hypothetical protein VK601_13840 [Kofleriaceae bacterium]|nr:hypothetical protein [Kofleriaceae bacterium]